MGANPAISTSVCTFDPNGIFRQKGVDVQVTLPVWPWEAALGAEVMAPNLTEPVKVKDSTRQQGRRKTSPEGQGIADRHR